MKVLITGATGKIGQKLINHLIDHGLSIRILSKRTALNLSGQIEIIPGDLFNQNDLLKAVENINTIVHLAAVTHSNNQELYWRTNVKGTENLIKAAKKARVSRLIFVSSRAINPNGGAYSQSKLAAEKIVKNSGINWVILRPAEVYGIGQREMIDRLINLVKKTYLVPIINTDKYSLAPLYINDLVDVLGKVISDDSFVNKTYVLAGPESFSFKELVEQICQFFKLKRLKFFCPLLLLKLFFKIINLIPGQSLLAYDQLARFLSSKPVDISLAQKDLGFKPISFQEGLALINERKDSLRS